ncbi:MAG: RNA polymerase sigma factor [Polyangiaceae bacterium]
MPPATERSLEAAMTRFAAGDDSAFGEVYDLASGPLFGFLTRLTRNPTLAEDLCHETFLRIHRARAAYRPGASVLPWAYTIARRLFLDSARSDKQRGRSLDDPQQNERPRDPGIPAKDAPADEQLEAARMLATVERALAGLPENQSTAFRLLKQEGLSVSEAAAVLGTTETAVKLRAHRAYEAIREALGDSGSVRSSK